MRFSTDGMYKKKWTMLLYTTPKQYKRIFECLVKWRYNKVVSLEANFDRETSFCKLTDDIHNTKGRFIYTDFELFYVILSIWASLIDQIVCTTTI